MLYLLAFFFLKIKIWPSVLAGSQVVYVLKVYVSLIFYSTCQCFLAEALFFMPFKFRSSLSPVVTPQSLRLHLNCCALNFLLAYEGTKTIPSLFFVFVWFIVAYLLSTWSCFPFTRIVHSD